MTTEEKKQKEEDFMMWITFLPDRVIEFKQKLPPETSQLLDESPDSLEVIETYIINNYNLDSFQSSNNNEFVVGFISYIGEVFQKNLPNAKWTINLDNEDDIIYKHPAIRSDKFAPFSPFELLLPMFHYKRGNLVKSIFDAKMRVSNDN